jgi:hypothetical protein
MEPDRLCIELRVKITILEKDVMAARARLPMPKFNLLCSAAILAALSAPTMAQDISANVSKTGNTVTVTANGMSVSTPAAPPPVDQGLTTAGNALLTVTGGSGSSAGTEGGGSVGSLANGSTVVSGGAFTDAVASSSSSNDFSVGGTSTVTPPSVIGAPTPPALPVPAPSLPALP